MNNPIFTVGHSTRSSEELIDILQSYGVQLLVDVRSYPGSRRCPWFGKEQFSKAIENAGLQYLHLSSVGGRRYEKDAEQLHGGWNEPGFRYYAAYASKSNEFRAGLQELLDKSDEMAIAIMCSEAVWWRCHRRIISDYIINSGYEVRHIMSKDKCVVASMTAFASPRGPVIYYPASG